MRSLSLAYWHAIRHSGCLFNRIIMAISLHIVLDNVHICGNRWRTFEDAFRRRYTPADVVIVHQTIARNASVPIAFAGTICKMKREQQR